MNFQKIFIAGNATRDAEQKTSKEGKVNYTTFGIGVSDRKGKTTFFPVVAFGKRGEGAVKHIHKGRPLLVEGRLDVAENGRFNVVAEQIVYGVDLKREAETDTGYASAKNSASQLRRGRTPVEKT